VRERLRVHDLDVRVEVVPRRASVRLTVERDATVTARVPARLDEDTLVRIIRDKSSWLYGKLAEREAEAAAALPVKEFVSGESFRYLGQNHRLKIVDSGPEHLRLFRGRFLLRRDRLDGAEAAFVTWYRAAGARRLPPRLAERARDMGVEPTGLRVRPLGYRWGSCGSDGSVNIHWATMQLPFPLIDYVLVHELAHLRHRDHGPAFWQLVEAALPGADERRSTLREVGASLWLP